MLARSATYSGSAATNVDKIGMALIKLKDALQASFVASGSLTGWRRTAQGDGISAVSSTLDADIWTGNSGKGYDDTGKAWSTAQANSISNALAYIQWTYYVAGVSTGTQIQIQRASTTSAGSEDNLNAGGALAGFTGTPTATAAPAGGTIDYWGGTSAFNSTGAFDFASAMTQKPTIANTTTFAWEIWVDDGTGAGGYLGEWHFCFADSSNSDRGMGMGFHALTETATADTHAWIWGGGTWNEAHGGDNLYTTTGGWIGASGTKRWRGTSGSTFYNALPVRFGDTADNFFPPGTGTQARTDIDGNYALMPLFWQLDDAPSTPTSLQKGRARSARIAAGGLAAHVYPHVATATDGSIWVIMGGMALPWPSGVSPTWGSTSSSSLWRVWSPLAPTPDTTPPVLGSFTPAAGAVSYDQSITFPVPTDAVLAGRYVVTVQFASRPDEVVWDGVAQSSDYSGSFPSSGTATATRTAGWPAAFTLQVQAVDAAGNWATAATAAYTITTSPNPAAPDTAPPVLGSFTPASGAIAYDQSITFPVPTDVVATGRYVVTVQFASRPDEVAWDGVATSSDYDAASSFPSSGTATLARDASWPDAFTVKVQAVDAAGNWATPATSAYTISTSPNPAAPDTTIPSIVNLSPAAASAITDTQVIEFDVVDTNSLAYVAVFARYLDKREYDVIWDGADFGPKYAVEVTATTVGGKPGFHFSVSRNVDAVGGWASQGRLRFKVVAIDAFGNAEAA